MGSEWKKIQLGDFVTVTHGYAFEGKHFSDDQTENVLVTPGNFQIGGGFKADKLKFYDGPLNKDYVLQPGELIVTMTDLSKQADTLGYPALVPNHKSIQFLHNQRIGRVLLKNENIDKNFLYYVLCSKPYRHEILSGATGTTVKHTAPTRIERFNFYLPPLETQR